MHSEVREGSRGNANFTFKISIRRIYYRAGRRVEASLQTDARIMRLSCSRVLIPLSILILRHPSLATWASLDCPLNRYFVVSSFRPVRLRTSYSEWDANGSNRALSTAILDTVDIYPIFRLRSGWLVGGGEEEGSVVGRETATDI